MPKTIYRGALTGLAFALLIGAPALAQEDPLPSWNEGATKQAILDFVAGVTEEGGDDYVDPADRLAVFDNDGTLWAEQPIYVQLAFAIDRVKALAPQHPDWETTEPYASILKGDVKGALAGGEHDVAKIIAATHSGITTDQFAEIVADWMAGAKNPVKDRRYIDMDYQPMLDLLAYLRANGFQTFIVSGGGIDFMRVFTEQVYGIPPAQVVGSSGKLKFDIVDGQPVLLKLPEIAFIDDKGGKPIGIMRDIGRRPIFVAGNSDGDMAMLQWTTAGEGPRFGMIVHHTDAEREWAYDRDSSIGKLDKGLDAAARYQWTVVDMAKDWKTIFPE